MRTLSCAAGQVNHWLCCRGAVGQDLTYEYRISRADWELIQSLRQHLPKEIDALYEVPALGEPVHVATVVLRSAADTVLAFAESNKQLLPYTYQFKPETLGDPRITPG